MSEKISAEAQEWFDKHLENIITVVLPNNYNHVVAVYDIKNDDCPIFGDYAIVFDNALMEIWVAKDVKHLEQQLHNN